jgi:hypothetical protein
VAADLRVGWHFLRTDGTTEHGRLRPAPGEILRHEGPLAVCHSGLHFCPQALDALDCAPGPLVERVEAVGTIIIGTGPHRDKAVTSARKCLWIADATLVLHEFACWCADRALQQMQVRGHKIDKRLRGAIAAKRAWLRGEIANSTLGVAEEEAWNASKDTATDLTWCAAWAASWSAALYAEAAARYAARDAAGAAADSRGIAKAATRDATKAVRDAARTAAWNAEREAQQRRLEEMLLALSPAALGAVPSSSTHRRHHRG